MERFCSKRTWNAKCRTTNLSPLVKRVTIFKPKEPFQAKSWAPLNNGKQLPCPLQKGSACSILPTWTTITCIPKPPALQELTSAFRHQGKCLFLDSATQVAQEWAEAHTNTLVHRIIWRHHTSKSPLQHLTHCTAPCPQNPVTLRRAHSQPDVLWYKTQFNRTPR